MCVEELNNNLLVYNTRPIYAYNTYIPYTTPGIYTYSTIPANPYLVWGRGTEFLGTMKKENASRPRPTLLDIGPNFFAIRDFNRLSPMIYPILTLLDLPHFQ